MCRRSKETALRALGGEKRRYTLQAGTRGATTGMVFAPQTLSFSEKKKQALGTHPSSRNKLDGLVKRKAKDVMGNAWPGYMTT